MQISKTGRKLVAITLGAELFANALEQQGVNVTRVAWRPSAGTTEALAKLLADPRVDQANAIAVERMLAAHPMIVDVQPAHQALTGVYEQRRLLHAGPPIAWERMCGPMRG